MTKLLPDKFPNGEAADRARSVLGASEGKESTLPLADISQALFEVMKRQAAYYQATDPASPEESRSTRVLRELQKAQEVLESGQPDRRHIKVELFSGQQSRNVANEAEWASAIVVQDLYNTFNQLAGRGPKNYHDIGTDAKAAKAAGWYIGAKSAYKYLMKDSPVVALSSSRDELYGVQLKIAPNIFATFTLDNLIDESRSHDGNVYLTAVTGGSTQR